MESNIKRDQSSSRPSVVIVGGGWAGLTAAIEATLAGYQVTVFEAAPQWGGRARACDFNGLTVDNGQHLFMGAYQHCFSIMKKIGLNPESFFYRTPFDLTIVSDTLLQLKAAKGFRAPWHLFIGGLFSKGITLSEKRSFFNLVKNLKPPTQDYEADVWLSDLGQSSTLIDRFWGPICLAALTTPINEASAILLYQVLHTVFFANPQHSDWYFPTKTLDRIFPLPAAEWLNNKGAKLYLGKRVTSILIENHQAVGVCAGGKNIKADYVIVATAARAAKRLLADSHLTALAKVFEPIQSEPISTLYIQFPESVSLGKPMIGFLDPLVQWVFDRGITHNTPGLLAVVTSGNEAIADYSSVEFSQAVVSRLNDLCPFLNANNPKTKWIRERHAAISASAGCQNTRPKNRTSTPGLWLAGDYCLTPYPSTIEGAMLSGQQCIQSIKKMKNTIKQGVITLEI